MVTSTTLRVVGRGLASSDLAGRTKACSTISRDEYRRGCGMGASRPPSVIHGGGGPDRPAPGAARGDIVIPMPEGRESTPAERRGRPPAAPVAVCPTYWSTTSRMKQADPRAMRSRPRRSPRERLLPIGDRRAGRGHLPIQRHEGLPRLRYLVFGEDRLDRALELAGVAVDALVGIDG